MKKIYLMLLMICSVCAFTACSDDDDDNQPTCPVTNYSVPAEATVGATVTITGTGFTSSNQIYLRDAQNNETQATGITATSTGLTFTVPSTLAAGSYTVVLKQNGNWDLGKITLEAAGPIEGLEIPANGTAGEEITIGGKGFDETTKMYLESDDLTTEEMPVTAVTATGITLRIPAILPGGNYRVMLAQGDGVELGVLNITAKSTACVISRIINDNSGDTTTFTYTNGKIASITVRQYEEDNVYTIEYSSATSVVVSYAPASEYTYPITYHYTLLDGKITKEVQETKETQYDDNGNETVADKTFEYTYAYTPENYLEQINQKPDENGYDTLYFNYANGKIEECIRSKSFPDYDNPEISSTNRDSIALGYDKQISNSPAFDVMAIIMKKINESNSEYLARLLGLGGEKPTQLPTSYDSFGFSYPITYMTLNGYVTKVVFPDDDPEFTQTYRLEYQ